MSHFEHPATVILRQPNLDEPELVIAVDEHCEVHQLSFVQLRYLLAQIADAVAKWPIGDSRC